MEQERQEKERLCGSGGGAGGMEAEWKRRGREPEKAQSSFGKKGWLYGAAPGILLLLFFFFFLAPSGLDESCQPFGGAVLRCGRWGTDLPEEEKGRGGETSQGQGKAGRRSKAAGRRDGAEDPEGAAGRQSSEDWGNAGREAYRAGENLQADYEECLEKRNQISEQDQVLEGIRLAHGRIEKLAAEHQNRYGGRLQTRISEIMGEGRGKIEPLSWRRDFVRYSIQEITV